MVVVVACPYPFYSIPLSGAVVPVPCHLHCRQGRPRERDYRGVALDDWRLSG